ncbi:L-2-amino-thiazoline-4-carboxylic acid hydrolase-like protein [Actinomycetospora succinea]|uniref:L-2-amino-thiazoline-4-carboxylic acid hydrolase-like protein n=1 Tax=Actinomycetospora succinea TaxID=663603 RepID=A0A4V6PX55_9PSEU|nr:L-2-amino-thiazoline-4-carboxylic acid hydrolase [Actinomycetospora succinea]TDQ65908.1 L-2-amino-thiazoline-4-carboxylic acid hydrolase-like protein [Actinomycetospora succinea]
MDETRTTLWELEGRWTMGRALPRDLLSTIGAWLRREFPDRRAFVLAVIRRRAEEIREEDAGLPVDGPAEGMLALSATVLAAHETLIDVFDGDARRTVLFLRQALGSVLRRPFQVTFGAPGRRDDPLGAIESACRAEAGRHGASVDIRVERPDADAVEMRVERCFFHDFFARRGVGDVTTVMCAWDATWMRAVDPAVSGLRAERTTLRSQGDDACRFRVVCTEDPAATFVDALR